MIPNSTELSANVVGFCRMLRDHGFPLGPAEEAGALRALSLIRIGDPDEFRLALRTVIPGCRKELSLFDDLYPLYWGGTANRKQSKTGIESESSGADLPGTNRTHRRPSLLAWNSEPEEEGQEALPGYSPMEVLKKKDFGSYTASDVEEAVKIIRRIARILSRRLSRRYRASSKRIRVDFRKTLRSSLRNAGEVIELIYRQRSPRKTRIVLLCDVSGSMESYSRFLVTFLYALQQAHSRIETFVFSTALHRVTDSMKADSLREALRGVSDSVRDWSGGTRIGECLQEFLHEYNRFLDQDTLVMILSDGWDVGEPGSLEDAMTAIHARADRVIWLNPLLGSPGYEPSCQGMQSAMPHIDLFLPAHNLDSLRDLADHLVSTRRRKGASPKMS